jgi:hypothetical protein
VTTSICSKPEALCKHQAYAYLVSSVNLRPVELGGLQQTHTIKLALNRKREISITSNR